MDEVFGSRDSWANCLAAEDHLDPLHHVALYLYGVEAYRLWTEEGGTPDALAGYSLGVYVALTAAGCLAPAAAADLVLEAGYAIRFSQPQLQHGLVAVNGLPVERATEVIDGTKVDGEIVLTHINSPSNFLLTCPRVAIEAVCARALEIGAYHATPATFPGASHSHLIEPYLGDYQKLVGEVDLTAPRTALFSCVTAAPVRTAEDARELLGEQLIRPVRFLDTIEAASPGGAERYVVVGTCLGVPALLAFLRPESEVTLWPADRKGDVS